MNVNDVHYVLHLSEITRFSNEENKGMEFHAVLHLSEITRFSNMRFNCEQNPDSFTLI